ncbi:senecionine N-oxygenase-like [Pectinophora gossypiella]|uniref:senecionine N-oxygenase-like n=1 Tax=Pectinophora gossypiella TaxID=13191 RepID=UPI00214E49EB|nr:senecionine N-oxygenase-like [Pectinophora gossypiella]
MFCDKMAYLWSCAMLLVNLILGVTDGLNVSYPTCVIGAGYSGLGAARYLKEYGVDFKVLEATRHVGGTWRFDPHVGSDEDGLPLFTSMYKNLRTNTPRQTMEYSGFPFPEDTPSYPTSTCFYRYLKNFTKEFDFEKHIQFRSLVTDVKWAGGHWNVTYHRTDTRVNQTEPCGFLIIASGEYRKPVMPKFIGQDTFRGTVIHSHDYKDPETYRGRRVLLVGAGASGLDLATHLSNVTAKLVHSHHLAYNQPYFGPNYVKKPDILSFTTDGVVFKDDSFEEIDDVIFCTGYDYEHSFLDKSCGITATSKFLLPLYQHMVNIRYPSMVFIGVPKKVINRVLDAQGQYAAALAAKKFELPSGQAMLRAWLDNAYKLQAKGMTMIDINVIGDEMDNYFATLSKEAGVVRAPPVLSTIRDFNAKNRLEDLLNYRDYDYKLLDDKHYERLYNLRKNHTCPIED